MLSVELEEAKERLAELVERAGDLASGTTARARFSSSAFHLQPFRDRKMKSAKGEEESPVEVLASPASA